VVDVEHAETDTEMALASTAEIYGNGQTIAPVDAQDWVTAVLKGCREGLEYLREQMLALAGDSIVQDSTNPSDTYRVDAVAFKCTYEVIDPPAKP